MTNTLSNQQLISPVPCNRQSTASDPDGPGFAMRLEKACEHLRFRGLMTLAVFGADEPAVRACFVRMRQLREQLLHDGLTKDGECNLSMGMSGDYEIAIEEGADVVRVGQALFGPRGVPDSHYWPGT